MRIVIADYAGNTLTAFEDAAGFAMTKKLNAGGSAEWTMRYDDRHLSESVLRFGNRVTIEYTDDDTVAAIFTGLVAGIRYERESIQITAVDYLGYLDRRVLRADKSYVGQTITAIVADLFSYIDGIHPLPMTIGANTVTDIVTIDFKRGQSLLACLKKIVDTAGEVREVDGIVDVAVQTGVILGGQFVYEAEDPQSSNVTAWEWELGADDFANAVIEGDGTTAQTNENAASITAVGLWEKYVYTPEGLTGGLHGLDASAKLPRLTIDTSRIAWWEMRVGDRKAVKIITDPAYASLAYTGIVQEMRVRLENGAYLVEIIASETYREPVESLGLLVAKLGKDIDRLQTHA